MEDFGLFIDGMCRYIGQTVTVFTTSGGLSGSGFTGVLLSVDPMGLRLLCDIGAAPACPVGSACGAPVGYGFGGFGYGGYGFGACGGGDCGNPLGAVAIIPLHTIACFTHNAI